MQSYKFMRTQKDFKPLPLYCDAMDKIISTSKISSNDSLHYMSNSIELDEKISHMIDKTQQAMNHGLCVLLSYQSLKDETDDLVNADGIIDEKNEGVKLVVDKQISANDIRARILRLPKAITNLLPDDAHKVKVIFNGLSSKELTIAKNRGYLAGVTDLYKESGLITEDGSYNPCKAIWKFSEDKIDITIKEH